jgi:hypothetical protein
MLAVNTGLVDLKKAIYPLSDGVEIVTAINRIGAEENIIAPFVATSVKEVTGTSAKEAE